MNLLNHSPKSSTNNKIYIYSSGSIKAQILLFGHVKSTTTTTTITNEVIDLNPKLNGYFDITTAGFKINQIHIKNFTRNK